MTQSTAAATDVGEFWTDLDGGTFDSPDEAAQARQDWIAASHPAPAPAPVQENLL